ncbi:MAG: hypothetical protein II922_05510 [Succinimonas sp.]|nr:hypothetical protein [Succinimonas sp.]
MLYFLARSLIVAVIVGSVFIFYGQIDDHLFIKALIALCSLFIFYWYDLYKIAKLFFLLFRSMYLYRHNRKSKAYPVFEWLLARELIVPLPLMALMRLTGDGAEQDIEAARNFCERAVFNEYFECYYLLGVTYFFQNSLRPAPDGKFLEVQDPARERQLILDELFREKKEDRENSPESPAPEKAAAVRSRFLGAECLNPDYHDAVFNLEMYFKFNYENEPHYGDAAALYGFCLMRGLGVGNPDAARGQEFLNTAKRLRSQVLPEIEAALRENRDIRTFSVEY